jgi:hypothetical protein
MKSPNTTECTCQYEEGHGLTCPLYVKKDLNDFTPPLSHKTWEEEFDEKFPSISVVVKNLDGFGYDVINRTPDVKGFIHSLIAEAERKVLEDMSKSIGSQFWRTIAEKGIKTPEAMTEANLNAEKWQFVQDYAKSKGISLDPQEK